MKTISLKSGFLLFAITVLLSSGFISCTKDDMGNDDGQSYGTTGNASGSQENPAVTTTGTATLSGSYDTKTNLWNYTVDWTTLTSTATAVQIFGPASAGVNGNFLFALTITTPGLNGSASGSIVLTEEQEAWLIAGQLYYTVLSASHITGEIRGQITATTR